MTVRFWLAPAAIVLGIVVTEAARTPATAIATAMKSQTQSGPGIATIDDQVDLAVTVYNFDLALIRDVRSIQLARGTADLHFMDIAATVNPATVHLGGRTYQRRRKKHEDLANSPQLDRRIAGRTGGSGVISAARVSRS